MKQIILMRHAKSSWDDYTLSDRERPLNKRGRRDAPAMAEIIKQKGIVPYEIYSSDSERTKETSTHLIEALPKAHITYTRELYHASARNILSYIKGIKSNASCIMILAHNPGITEAFRLLGNVSVDNVPTSGIGCFSFNCKSFREINEFDGDLEYFVYPKML